jgi:hypothetical protein
MYQVTLPDKTAEKLEQVASYQGMNATDLLLKLVEDYLTENVSTHSPFVSDLRVQKIEAEQKQYEAQHSTLLKLYKDQYIAMHEGEVIDHDLDRVVLSRRVRQHYGNTPVFIVQVRNEPRLTIYVRSPRMAKASE